MLDLVFSTIASVLIGIGTLTGFEGSHTVAVSAHGIARVSCVLPSEVQGNVPGDDVFVSAGRSVHVTPGQEFRVVVRPPAFVFPESANCPPQTKSAVVTSVRWTRALVQVVQDDFGPVVLEQRYVVDGG